MQISVLGELAVRRNERVVQISAPKQRMLFALLIANLRQSVSLDRTLETLYGDHLPGNPARALRFHVSKLRSALEPNKPATQRTGVIRTTPNGYELDVEPSTIDAHRFAALATRAADLLNLDPAGAAAAAATAQDLWTGDPLSEFEYEDFAQPLRTELLERKLCLDETGIEAMLAMGDNDAAVGLLRSLTEQHPYREGLWSLLMTALYRAGRQVEALAAYRSAQELLVEDLGIDPGPKLTHLEHQILTQAPELLPATAAGIPHNLPPPVPLVGRDTECAALEGLIHDHRLIHVSGLPGVGKSALAIEVAHELAETFPDGVLYVKVGADRTSRQIVESLSDGLARVGPKTVDDGNVIRTIADMDALVLVDEGHCSESAVGEVVGRLLAEGDRATVVVTTRAPSSELPAANLIINPLDPATDGVRLLRGMLGDDEYGDRSDLATLAEIAGGVPGALSVAATALRIGGVGSGEPHDTGRAIVDASRTELADEVSDRLPDAAARLARRLALFPEGLSLDEMIEFLDTDSGSVAVLNDVSVLASTGVVVADPRGYRIAPVLAPRFGEAVSAPDRRSVLTRAAKHFARSPGTQLPANAEAVAVQLIEAGGVGMALRLLARLGSVWWQQPARARFADLCSRAMEASDGPIDRDLEAVLFFATHAFLDLGDENASLRLAAQYADVAANLDEPAVTMHAHQMRGNVSAYAGSFADAEHAYAAALDVGRRIGHPETTWIAASRSAVNVILGDAETAEAGADEVDALATIRRQTRGRGLAAELRGSAALQRGDTATATVEYARAHEIATSCGAARDNLVALRRLSETHIADRNTEAAARSANDAAALCEALGLPQTPPLIAATAMVAAERGDQERADRRLADLQGSLRYRRPAAWIHGALIAATVVHTSAGRNAEAAVSVAVLDDVGRRSGIVLPGSWETRIGEARAAGALEPKLAARALATDPVDVIA